MNVKVVDTPFGKRPFRVHIDPTQDGADVAFPVMDRLRSEMLHRVGLSELLTPGARGGKNRKQRMRSSKVHGGASMDRGQATANRK